MPASPSSPAVVSSGTTTRSPSPPRWCSRRGPTAGTRHRSRPVTRTSGRTSRSGRRAEDGALGRRLPAAQPGRFARLGAMAEKYRIVVAKPGLDGHDRGAKIVARALRDAGFEVIYTGLHQTPEQIVETAIQEDADAVGLSLHSGAHMTLFPKVVRMLRERGAEDILVFGGGIVPDVDIAKLEAEGVERIFTPGATTTEIVEWLRGRLERAPTG